MPQMANGRKGCATCEFWGGSRNANLSIVVYESDSSIGNCYYVKNASRPTRAVDYCIHHKKWSRI